MYHKITTIKNEDGIRTFVLKGSTLFIGWKLTERGRMLWVKSQQRIETASDLWEYIGCWSIPYSVNLDALLKAN